MSYFFVQYPKKYDKSLWYGPFEQNHCLNPYKVWQVFPCPYYIGIPTGERCPSLAYQSKIHSTFQLSHNLLLLWSDLFFIHLIFVNQNKWLWKSMKKNVSKCCKNISFVELSLIKVWTWRDRTTLEHLEMMKVKPS